MGWRSGCPRGPRCHRSVLQKENRSVQRPNRHNCTKMIEPLRSKRFWQDFDWSLFGAALFLSIISLTEIYSSTMSQPTENYFLRQGAWVLVGILVAFIVAAMDYHAISEHIPWLYILAVGVLLYTLALGRTVAGSKSWISLGPVSFQPSEPIKMVVVVALARYLSELRSAKYMTLSQIVKAAIICLLPMSLVALQGDLGT